MAKGINSSGQIAGYSNNNNGTVATVWNGTNPTALGNLPGATQSSANGINNSGQVVGFTNSGINGNPIATLWNGR